jgi:hypothetical protein
VTVQRNGRHEISRQMLRLRPPLYHNVDRQGETRGYNEQRYRKVEAIGQHYDHKTDDGKFRPIVHNRLHPTQNAVGAGKVSK